MATSLRLDFGNLPLVEVAVRATFAESIPLKFSVLSAVHDDLKSSFPDLREPQRFEVAPGVTDEQRFGPGHITGAVLTGHTFGLQATIQSRVAVLRWLKQATASAPEYPRFVVLRDTMREVTEAIKAANKLDTLGIVVVNMSYVNFIPITDYSSVIRDYFSSMIQVKAIERAEEVRKVELSWRESGLDLRFCLEKTSASFGDEENIDGCRLTTVAGTHLPQPNGDGQQQLEDVHGRLQIFFREVISDRAKDEWQLREVPNG